MAKITSVVINYYSAYTYWERLTLPVNYLNPLFVVYGNRMQEIDQLDDPANFMIANNFGKGSSHENATQLAFEAGNNKELDS